MNDYERVARLIRYLESNRAAQPGLAELAAYAGLSPFHLHRLFSAWAGITPKDFLQCLTLAHAKAMLRTGAGALDTALAAGLSGPGRLHDLCVSLEAASPGELKSGGAGWNITFGMAPSPFGRCLIAESPRGICQMAFVDDEASAVAGLRADWPRATFIRDDAAAGKLAARVFGTTAVPAALRPANGAPLRAFVRGTPFQVRVWRALLQVPGGSLVSYQQLAAAIGRPTAARAVGSAVGQNPIAYLIPCHRVIRQSGLLGCYHWGLDRKRALIAWETAPRTHVEQPAQAR
jgi:AraC family transcriptional regulator of adaptative response/methylated-DNA-[protein]-cysteine methyltransferase